MYIHSAPAARSAADELCPPSYPLCDPTLSAGPGLAEVDDESNPGDTTLPLTSIATTPGPDGGAPQPQAALAGTIQHLGGRRNFVGIVVLAVLVFVGLVLWLSFGQWPRAGIRRVRARFARGDKRAKSDGRASGGAGACGEDPDPDQATGRDLEEDEARVRDEKRGDEAAGAAPTGSPLPAAIEVDSLEKDAEQLPARKGPRVHFA